MKRKNISITMNQGASGFYYVRVDGLVMAGFVEKPDAEMYVKIKYPESSL